MPKFKVNLWLIAECENGRLYDEARAEIVKRFGEFCLDEWGRGEIEMSLEEAADLRERYYNGESMPIVDYWPVDRPRGLRGRPQEVR